MEKTIRKALKKAAMAALENKEAMEASISDPEFYDPGIGMACENWLTEAEMALDRLRKGILKREVSMALCEGRHEIPQAEDGAIFGNNLNPLDLLGMAITAEEKLMDVQILNLYVTGLTVALVTVINVCHNKGIDLTLWHFDRESGEYYPQKVR